MYLYEKNNGKIDVYELNENKEKIKEYKKQEMSKLSKDDIVFKMIFNNVVYATGLSGFDSLKKEYILDKKVKNIKNKILVEKQFYDSINNKIIIDGILQNYYEGTFDHIHVKNIKNKDVVEKSFLILDNKVHILKEGGIFSNDIFEIPNILTLPESLVILKDLREKLLYRIYDKNIDEQLALFDFSNEPVGRYDIEIINNLLNHEICTRNKTENELEISQNVLRKVRMINK